MSTSPLDKGDDPSPDQSLSRSPTTETASANHSQTKQKRMRSQLSCTPCRQGKLKCNRAHDPACDQCIKRNRESHCAYPPPPAKNKPSKNVKGRIRQLESLVVDLMNQNKLTLEKNQTTSNGAAHRSAPLGNRREPHSEPTPPSENDMTEDAGESTRGSVSYAADSTVPLFGRMRISREEISYVGDSHWDAILGSISDLKKDFDEEAEEDSPEEPAAQANQEPPETIAFSWTGAPTTKFPHSASGLGFVLGQGTATVVTRKSLLAALPEKRIADRLLSQWFNSPDPFKPIIHAPTFQDEYRRLWREPQNIPVMWLGLLFAILSLATSFGLRNLDPSSPKALAILKDSSKYHQLSASAATLADFTRPKPHTLECLIIYSAGMRSNDAFVNVWLMWGLIVRLALRMGYHRDGSHYPAISEYEGEMRRRLWAIVSMVDILVSFQLGLPGMVNMIAADAKAPRNLLDRDFSVSTTILPPNRSLDELTPSSYTRGKMGIVNVFAKAAEFSHMPIVPPYDEMMVLDRQLEEARKDVPPMLQMPDISEAVTDPAEQLMCRFNLALLYLKTKIVLHRRYMLTPLDQLSTEERRVGIGKSRMSCVDASIEVLQHHHTIYLASQPGGQLESVKWYMASISTHDFLLAAMIICLDLSHQINNHDYGTAPDGTPCRRRADLVGALERSYRIWNNSSKLRSHRLYPDSILETSGNIFDETDAAARALRIMIEKVKKTIGLAQTVESWPNTNQAMALQSMSGVTNFEPSPQPDPIHDSPMTAYGDEGIDNNGHLANQRSTHEPPSASTITPPDSNHSTADTTQSEVLPSLSQPKELAMIGDMLDLNDVSMLDWETWDKQVNSGYNNTRANQGAALDEMMGLTDSFDFNQPYAVNELGYLAGNTIIGGSGLVEPTQTSLLNNTSPNGGVSAPRENFQYLWTFDPLLDGDASLDLSSFGTSTQSIDPSPSFSLSNHNAAGLEDPALLQDVNFNLGVSDYNRNGMYPASKEDWADFRARQRMTR